MIHSYIWCSNLWININPKTERKCIIVCVRLPKTTRRDERIDILFFGVVIWTSNTCRVGCICPFNGLRDPEIQFTWTSMRGKESVKAKKNNKNKFTLTFEHFPFSLPFPFRFFCNNRMCTFWILSSNRYQWQSLWHILFSYPLLYIFKKKTHKMGIHWPNNVDAGREFCFRQSEVYVVYVWFALLLRLLVNFTANTQLY